MVFHIYSLRSEDSRINRYAITCSSLYVSGASMLLIVVFVMRIREEESLHYDVSSECDRRNAEAGEGALEAVPSCERTGVSPGFAVGVQYMAGCVRCSLCLLSRPGIAFRARRGGSELPGIEAGDGGALGEPDAARRSACV